MMLTNSGTWAYVPLMSYRMLSFFVTPHVDGTPFVFELYFHGQPL